jgi:beta-glucosidase
LSLISAIIKLHNKLSQKSVFEVDDGITSCDEIRELCRKVTAEGCVLLKNDGTLPLGNQQFALFGRCQINTFYVGYGSGGDVKPPYKVSILEGLRAGGANLDIQVVETYEHWTKNHIPDEGYWGHWPMCYKEMPVKDEFIASAAKRNTTAVVVIGRAAGEDRENKIEKGSWFLTDTEDNLLALTRKYFKKVCVMINSGSIMDVTRIEKHKPDALMFVWQGGQETGNAVADVLLGKVSPSGKLTDTIAAIEDYPSYKYFGNKKYNNYAEDIYVGYRYFNTFARDKIIYPFGFGLSYTKFEITDCKVKQNAETTATVTFTVKNAGDFTGKQVVQVYLSVPQGKLGKPSRELAAYVKTKELAPNESQTLSVTVELKDFASFDDMGVTGYKNSFVLESGEYKIFIGENVSCVKVIYTLNLDGMVLIKACEEACAPRYSFKRMVNAKGVHYENTPVATVNLRERVLNRLPKTFERKNGTDYSFQDVIDGKITPDEFVAEFTPEELDAFTRGSLYMMDSPYGPKGNAGTFGANCQPLFDKGIPAISTNDGPSGARLQAHSTLLPNGVALASSFNDELVENLTYEFGKEVIARKSHVLLAPGINIHRNPLCGRNFEYFSEDPYLTGKMAVAYIKGVQSAGASATPKHFACNNQESKRGINDSRVSQRALREIYLKGFEICIKEANPDCLMTSYNKLNGVYNYFNYELVTTILRDDWGYKGCVMTDWWMKNGKSKHFKTLKTQAYRVRAQVDVFMPGAPNYGIHKGKSDGTLLKSLNGDDGITLAELQRSAKNVLKLCIKHSAK